MRLFRRKASVELLEGSRPRVLPVPRGPIAELIAVGLVIIGALLVTVAYREAPASRISSYDPTFWAGMVLAYLAVTWRATSGRYTVQWLGLLGLFTVLPKFWMSRNGPVYFDETAHFSLLEQTIAGGKIFQYSPLLPIGTYYPGLESMAATVHWLTGLSPWDSALALLAVAHSLVLVQVYYIARALQVPHRWAAVAAPVYATNPSFVYEDMQFAYESVAILLMLTIVRLYLEALAAERSGGRTWRQTLTTSLLIAALSVGCVVTHHLTSLTGTCLLLLGALFVKPISGFADRKGGRRRLFARWSPALLLGGCFALWIALIAPETVPYLFPHVSQPAAQLIALGSGSKASGIFRSLFSHSTAPKYEQVAAVSAPVLISLALLAVSLRWLRRRRLRANFLWPIVLTAAYLVSLPLTLIAAGAAGAHRTWASTFIGVTMLPAALVPMYGLAACRRWLRAAFAAAGAAGLVILLVGNIAAGTPIDYRFPGGYKFGSDTLDVTPETLTLVRWVHAHLGRFPRIVTDRFTAVALTGRAGAFTPLQTRQTPIAAIWYNHHPPQPSLMFTLQRQRDGYLVVDVRDAEYSGTESPLFVAGEPARVPERNIARLEKWPWLKLLYATRHYRVYRIDYNRYYLWYPFNSKDQ